MIQPQKTPMRQQDPKVRIHNFNEVPLGYSEEEAVREAERCLQCKNAPCIAGCPVSIDIPRFIEQVKNRQFAEAIATIKESNSLPLSVVGSARRRANARGSAPLGSASSQWRLGSWSGSVPTGKPSMSVQRPRPWTLLAAIEWR